MHVCVLMFGPAKDLAGSPQVELNLPQNATVADLRKALAERSQEFAAALPAMRIAVNNTFAPDDAPVRSGDELAVIPPVSGGTDNVHVELTSDPISVADVLPFVSNDPSCGAIVTFTGTTRAESDADHGALVHLEYEAYIEMATTRLHALAETAIERWRLTRVALVHRIGVVPPTEASVVIAVTAGHRNEAFEACRWLIDTLKKDVPIWKKDVFEDGRARWVNPGG